ncbi:MAG: hypothetical protein WD052_11690 [Bacteroidales bacterium]
MKKFIIYLAVIPGLLTAIILKSCSGDDDMTISVNEENLVIHDDPELRNRIDSDPLKNNIYRVELLGYNEELESLIAAVEKEVMDLSVLNLYGVRKYYLNNSEIRMYAIPYNNSENSVIVYKYDELYQVNLAEFTTGQDGITQFRLTTIDGALYYGMSINQENEVGEFVHSSNRNINEFSNAVYQRTLEKPVADEGTLKYGDTCCRRMANWEGCFECTVSFFAKKWYGLLAFAAIGKEFVAAIGISCIGAGPSTFC